MASSGSLISEEHFQCAICLDVFKQPVSTPCGHNFCMSCITAYWDDSVVCQCPFCKTTFDRKPDLRVNTFISVLAEQFKALELTGAVTRTQNPQPANSVLCDVCTIDRKEAVKSCMNCLTSYCNTHVEPHRKVAGLKRHALLDPVDNLEDSVCKEHNMLLKAFCRSDQVLLCDVCVALIHANHDSVPVPQAHCEMKARLVKMDDELQQMIQERLQKISKAKESALSKDVVANNVQDLAALMSDIQKTQAELLRVIEEKPNLEAKQVDDFVSSMEREIAELQSATITIRELKQTENPLRFLQNFPIQSLLPHTMDLSTFSCKSHLGVQRLKTSLSLSVSQMQAVVAKINEDINKFSEGADGSNMSLRDAQQFEVTFVLNSKMGHIVLNVSRDYKQVRYSSEFPVMAGSQSMFAKHFAVLGNIGFSSRKFYFEVDVGQKTKWSVGVATAPICWPGAFERAHNFELWAIRFMCDRFESYSSPDVTVHRGKVQRVGVFVDYTGGQIAFYDVHTSTLIHWLTKCVFTEPLYPYLHPGDDEYGANWDPMVIVPVSEPSCTLRHDRNRYMRRCALIIP